jgi:molybdenum cofactor cytidylyltransferase
MIIRGIILAGGLSKRMGKNKLSLEINDKPIIEYVIDNAKNSRLDNIIVVWGKYEVHTDIPTVYNPNYINGMSTSIIEGLKGFNGDGAMIILGDMPFVTTETINELIATFEIGKKGIILPRYEGKKGNPVIIGKRYFKDLLENKGDKGARDIISNNFEDIAWVEVKDNSILIDIDDEESLTIYNSLEL